MAESDQTRGEAPPPQSQRDVLVPLRPGAGPADERRLEAEQRCLAAEQRCFEAEKRRLEAERRRDHLERLLEEMRGAGVRMRQIVGELSRLAAHLRHALDHPGAPSGDPPAAETVETDQRAEMADALAIAVERLRARVAAVGEPAPRPASPAPAPVERRPSHKHSMSWIARWRARRKQRLSR